LTSIPYLHNYESAYIVRTHVPTDGQTDRHTNETDCVTEAVGNNTDGVRSI